MPGPHKGFLTQCTTQQQHTKPRHQPSDRDQRARDRLRNKVLYINNGDHDNPHESPKNELEGCDTLQNTLYSHFTHRSQDFDWFDRLHYIYKCFQDSKKMYQLDPKTETPVPDDDSLYPYINNDIKYRLFEDVVDSYYLDSQIKDDFQCDHDCYSHQWESTVDDHSIPCMHACDHIVQHIQDLSDSTQQHTLHSMEENVSLFTDDATIPCDFNITNQNSVTENTNDTNISHA